MSTDAAPRVDATDLAQRWGRARRAALRSIVPAAPVDLDEIALLGLARATDAAAVERRVFDNSHLLGRSFRAWSRADLTLVDLSALLPALGAPCAAGGFARVETEPASRSSRRPCAFAGTPGACAYWRESQHGLVSGLSTTIRHTRVESPEAGGACVDLLHVDAESPLRLAPIPDALLATLEGVARKLGRVLPGAEVEFLGMQEGALFVRTRQPPSSCGLNLDQLLLGSLKRALPALPVRNATPRPVLTD